ncbi:MAG: DUF4105 domain-containing protein [Bdellovibrionota bacterium]
MLSASAIPKTSFAQPNEYLNELIAKARSQQLWEKPAWKKILFIADKPLSLSSKSLLSDNSYFFASDGRKNPEHELIATLNAFFNPSILQPENRKMPAQCLYAARFYWLVNELGIDSSKIKFEPCSELHEFIDALHYTGVSLVFSNYFAASPGSLFGHTFLRLHRTSQMQTDSPLLDDIANYSASVPDAASLLYPIKGLAGGYKGIFALMPYYSKIQEYNNYESRDLWEYELNLSDSEIRMLEYVLWEVGWTYIDYYYLDDNCSYIMLSVLEAAKPELHLTDKLWLYAIPADTVRVIKREPHLVKNIHYRPSVLSRYLARLSVLNSQEKVILNQLVMNNKSDSAYLSEIFKNCDQHCKTKVIDTALEFIDYKEKLVGSHNPVVYGNLRNNLLVMRAKEAVKSDVLVSKVYSSSPDKGHDSGLVSLNFGTDFHDNSFSDLRWRPALHGMEEDDLGYSDSLGIGFLDTIFRIDYKNRDVHLKNFHLLEISSLPAAVPNVRFLSWHFDTGAEYGFGFGDAQTQTREYLQLGLGSSFFFLDNHFLIYGLAHGDMGYSHDFGFHMGPSFTFGSMARISPYFKLIAKSEIANRYNFKTSIDSIKTSVTLASYFSNQFEGRLVFADNENVKEMSMGIQYYF